MKRNNFSESEAELVDVMDTLQRTISIIEKEIAKNPYILAEGNRHTEHEQRDGSSHHKEDVQCQESSANSVNDEACHRADHRPVPFKSWHSDRS